MFTAFALFGVVPLVIYWLLEEMSNENLPNIEAFAVASVASFLTLFGLGAARSALAEGGIFKGGILMALQGSAAGGLSFAIGYVLTGGQNVAG